MSDDKLKVDEAQRALNYEAIKSEAKADVRRAVVNEPPTIDQSERVEEMADDMRQRAVDEVAETDREVGRGRVVARISQIVDYIFFLIYGVLVIRLLLELFAARESAGFFQLIKQLTDPFYAPFRGLVPTVPGAGEAKAARLR